MYTNYRRRLVPQYWQFLRPLHYFGDVSWIVKCMLHVLVGVISGLYTESILSTLVEMMHSSLFAYDGLCMTETLYGPGFI